MSTGGAGLGQLSYIDLFSKTRTLAYLTIPIAVKLPSNRENLWEFHQIENQQIWEQLMGNTFSGPWLVFQDLLRRGLIVFQHHRRTSDGVRRTVTYDLSHVTVTDDAPGQSVVIGDIVLPQVLRFTGPDAHDHPAQPTHWPIPIKEQSSAVSIPARPTLEELVEQAEQLIEGMKQTLTATQDWIEHIKNLPPE